MQKHIKITTNSLWFYGWNFIALWSPTCFGHPCGHLQNDLSENSNTITIKMCINHSTLCSDLHTCWWPSYNKITSKKLKGIFGSLLHLKPLSTTFPFHGSLANPPSDITHSCNTNKCKGKVFPLQARCAQRMGRGIALLFHDRGTRRGWVVSSTLRPHFTPGKDPVSILQEAGWAPGPVWTGGKPRPHRDSIPNRPARSQSVYRLSYWAHLPILTAM